MIVDEVDGALGSGGCLDGSNTTKGMGLIVDYLKKCINYEEKINKKKAKGDDDDDDDFDINKKD